jgi:hypothetical protein
MKNIQYVDYFSWFLVSCRYVHSVERERALCCKNMLAYPESMLRTQQISYHYVSRNCDLMVIGGMLPNRKGQ